MKWMRILKATPADNAVMLEQALVYIKKELEDNGVEIVAEGGIQIHDGMTQKGIQFRIHEDIKPMTLVAEIREKTTGKEYEDVAIDLGLSEREPDKWAFDITYHFNFFGGDIRTKDMDEVIEKIVQMRKSAEKTKAWREDKDEAFE